MNKVRYPWHTWLKEPKPGRNRKLELVRGQDYLCMTHGMAVQVRNAASLRGMRVSVLITESGLLVTIYGDTV
jgi:hypothetical protein